MLHPAEPFVILHVEVISAFVHVYPCVVWLPGDALDHILRVRSEIDLFVVVVEVYACMYVCIAGYLRDIVHGSELTQRIHVYIH